MLQGTSNHSADALKGLGNACGHNLIAIVSLGAALAAAKVIQAYDLGGKVVLFGTPAEGPYNDYLLGIDYFSC